MAISKQDAALGAAVLLILLMGKKVLAAPASSKKKGPMPHDKEQAARDAAHAATANGNDADAAALHAVADAHGDDDGAALMKRANQDKATAWASIFIDHPVSPLEAGALARWSGIEASGNPLAHSKLDERGLMQAGPQSVAEHELTQAQWDAILDPLTSKSDQASIAIAYVNALAKKAATHLSHDPADPVDRTWYAKLYHQRPVDVRDAHLTGDAHADARRLATEWANDAKAMHRLRAANVVAWGTPTP